MPLTDTAARKAKPREKAYKLSDAGGLYLFVTPSGSKCWRLKYRFGGKEKTLSIGPYPAVTLAKARDERENAKDKLLRGLDPSSAKRETDPSASETFEATALEWFDLNKATWTETHADNVLQSLKNDVFPEIGSSSLGSLKPPRILEVLRKIEARPAVETAHRVRQRISAVFVYAIAAGKAETDPAAIVKGALAPVRKGRQPAITDLEGARSIIQAVDACFAHPVTKLAHRFLALTYVRPGTLLEAPWSEMPDLSDDEPIWRIPAARMKMRLHHKGDSERDHMVPLPKQAIETLRALHVLTGGGTYLFPNSRYFHKPMSENAIGYLLNRAGYHHRHAPHGWRSTFSTVMNERFPEDRQIIDLMLAHVPKDRVERAYNRAAYLKRRTELQQEWADLLMVNQTPADELLRMPRR